MILAFFIVSAAWTISLFLAPFMIPPGTVDNLDGWSNRIDYGEIWEELPLYPRIVYYLGDAQCHQKFYRTLYLNGNEMPVCSRDASIFLFITVGLFTAMVTRPSSSILQGIMNVFPSRLREFVGKNIGYEYFVPFFIVWCLLPVAIDGGLQLFTPYESTNLKRVLTGVPTGWISGFLLGTILSSIKHFDIEAKLPQERERKQWMTTLQTDPSGSKQFSPEKNKRN